MEEFELCPKLCFVQKNQDECIGTENKPCKGACKRTESRTLYNIRVQQAIAKLKLNLPSFALVDTGRTAEEQSVILIEHGHLHGMGYVKKDTPIDSLVSFKSMVQQYPSNDYIRNLIHSFASKNPERIMTF